MEGRSPQGAAPFFFCATVFSHSPSERVRGWHACASLNQRRLGRPVRSTFSRSQPSWACASSGCGSASAVGSGSETGSGRGMICNTSGRGRGCGSLIVRFLLIRSGRTSLRGISVPPAAQLHTLDLRVVRYTDVAIDAPYPIAARSSPWRSDPAGRTGGVSQTRSIADTVPFPPGSQLVG